MLEAPLMLSVFGKSVVIKYLTNLATLHHNPSSKETKYKTMSGMAKTVSGMDAAVAETELPVPKTLALVLAAALAAYFVLFLRRKEPGPAPVAPGPPGWPIIGHLLMMGSLPHRAVDALSKRYGPIMSIRLGTCPCVVASSADMARQFLKTHDAAFAGRPRIAAGKYTTYEYQDITWSQYNDHWRLARKICLTELFSAKRLEVLAHIRVQEVRRAISAIYGGRGGPIKLRDETSTLSNNIISRMVFGKRYLDEKAGHRIRPQEFREMIEELFVLNGVLNLGDFIPVLGLFDFQGYVRRMKKVSKKLNLFLEEVIEEHRERMRGTEKYTPQDLVDVLLQLADDPQIALSRTRLKAYTQDIIAGGTESSATLIEWGLAELLRSPASMERAKAELGSVVGLDRWVEESDLPDLPYIVGIVKETMRLHPVAPFLVPRAAREACTINGYHIPVGTRILVNVWTIGRDEKLWKDPLQFKPERFLDSSIDVVGRDYELLPFGSGRRMCPGYSLGYKVVKLGLANFIHGFDWKLPPGIDDLDMTEKFGLSTPKADPLVAVVKPRLAAYLYNFSDGFQQIRQMQNKKKKL